VVTNADGTIILANATAERMLGFGANEMIDEFVGVIFPMSSTVHLLPNLMKIALDEGGFDSELTLMTLEEEPVPVKLIATSYHGEGTPVIIFRFLDWREVNEMMRHLKDTGQAEVLDNLSRSMAHEILNPVSVIGVYVRKLIGSLPEGSEDSEWAHQVVISVEALESLVETVSNFINLPDPTFRKGSLQEVLDTSIRRTREETGSSGVEIHREGSDTLPEIYLDPVLLEKALTAVIMNAAERMPDGGQLTVARSADDINGRISVADTGPALSHSQMEEDLSPVRVARSHHSNLNLAIARKIIDEHGGEMTLASHDPMALTVDILLPVDRRSAARRREQ
jgi:nitrogen-specific signal transduction histidine kinase